MHLPVSNTLSAMKRISWLTAIIPFFIACKQAEPKKAIDLSAVEFSYELPDIADGNTFYFDGGKVFYSAMDSSGKSLANCFSLKEKRICWTVKLNESSIKKGAITSTGEYLFQTLSNTLYLVDSNGNYRVQLLDDRCKIAPVVYGNTFLVQDRGVGLKLFDAQSLQQLWIIHQPGSFTISQPFLFKNDLIYVINDDSLQSAAMKNGKLNWSTPVKDSLMLQALYGHHGEQAFVLSSDLKSRHAIASYDMQSGRQLWKQKIDSNIDVWNYSMVAANGKLYCKGYEKIYIHDLQSGRLMERYECPALISTKLLADSSGNIWFGMEDLTLVKLNRQLKPQTVASFDRKPEQVYMVNDSLYVYAYPRLYLMK